jgi:chromosomal replication initiator protein
LNTSAEELWNDVCNNLKKQLNPDIFSRWIAVIKPVRIEENKFIGTVSNDFYQSWLEEHYVPLINKTLRETSQKIISIKFEVSHDPDKIQQSDFSKKTRSAKKSKKKKFEPSATLFPNYIFDSFVVGSCNNFAHASSLAVAQAPGKAYNPLFIYGDVGLGKTHLMQAIGQYTLSHQKGDVCYIPCETLMNEYIDALGKRKLHQFRKKYRSIDVLLIDDIHFLANKGALQEEFFHTFNDLFNARKQIVMTCDRPAAEISGLEKRLVSRFEWGLVTELGAPDFETRMAILRSKRRSLNIQLPEEVITFIGANIKSNIRSLEGALTTVTSYAGLYHKPITIDLTRSLLQVMISKEKQEPITLSRIQKKVADYYDIRLSEMISKHRSRGVAEPRQLAMYLCRKLTSASLPEIGSAFEKTHATVLHAYKNIEDKQQTNANLKENIAVITHKLESENK